MRETSRVNQAARSGMGAHVNRILMLAYGGLSYVIFFGTFLYAIGFVENMVVPKGIDDGTVGAIGPAMAINVACLGLFGLQHRGNGGGILFPG